MGAKPTCNHLSSQNKLLLFGCRLLLHVWLQTAAACLVPVCCKLHCKLLYRHCTRVLHTTISPGVLWQRTALALLLFAKNMTHCCCLVADFCRTFGCRLLLRVWFQTAVNYTADCCTDIAQHTHQGRSLFVSSSAPGLLRRCRCLPLLPPSCRRCSLSLSAHPSLPCVGVPSTAASTSLSAHAA